MNKREFLKKGIGLAGVVATLPITNLVASSSAETKTTAPLANELGGCTLIPTETAGPFPLDLTENTFFFRQDVREDTQGVQFNLRMKIIGLDNCLPMPNLRVNIWHCSNLGLYSGYDNNMNAGQAGLTYLRGYQFTDANGEVEFVSNFPGWYNGRICHIHFQIHVSSSYSATSQMTFDIPTKNAIYAAHTDVYSAGPDPTQYLSDNVFSDGYSIQIADITPNTETGGYDGYLEVTVQGNGTVGIGHIESETAKNVVLGQNYPNPFKEETNIPFTLTEKAEVKIELWDISGNKIATVLEKELGMGSHSALVNFKDLDLPVTSYVYQIEVKNTKGIFRTCKMMTAVK
jgi:protocatechuate 3,4-dioxygenase beta subunit